MEVMRTRTPAGVAASAAALALLTGCGSSGVHDAGGPVSPSSSGLKWPSPTVAAGTTSAPPTPVRPTPPPSKPAAPRTPPAYAATVQTVTAADLPHSWHEGCPVGPSQLRRVRLVYWGFDGAAHTGTLIVAASAVPVVTTAFHRMYDARFPIRQMVPIDVYGGDDDRSVAADNTSSFNCRAAVADGPKHWSAHAYGLAIDINPFENPYVQGTEVTPPGAASYADRSRVRPGMIVPGGVALRAFTDQGWGWGGVWNTPDYQHVSRSGH